MQMAATAQWLKSCQPTSRLCSLLSPLEYLVVWGRQAELLLNVDVGEATPLLHDNHASLRWTSTSTGYFDILPWPFAPLVCFFFQAHSQNNTAADRARLRA